MNEQQSTEPTNRWDTTLYEERHSYVWKYGADLVELLAPQPAERILDLGAGTGHLSAKIAATGAKVIGLDADSSMVEQARHNYPDLQFVLGDGTDFSFPAPFDAVFSNATLHWIKRAAAAVACIASCLRPGGRLVAEFGGKGNIQSIILAIDWARGAMGFAPRPELNPWYFPGISEYATLLEQQGLSVTYANLFYRPTPLDGEQNGLRDWITMFATGLLADIPADQHPEVLRHIEDQLRPNWYREGKWIVDYRRLRVMAIKEHAS